MSIWLNASKNSTKSLSYVYKYIYQERGQLQKRLMNLMSSVVINYRCRLNQDFTKAHLPKYKLLSECRPTRGIFAYRTHMPHWEKHVCNDEKHLLQNANGYTCEMSVSNSVRRRRMDTMAGQNATRTSGDNKYVVLQCIRKYTLK